MSLFRVRRDRTERRDLVSSSWIPMPGDWARSPYAYPVNTDTALRLSAVYACVSLIANSLSTTPIDVYRKRDGRRVPVEPTPPLLVRPFDDTTMVEWLFPVFSSLLLRGNTYGYKFDFDELGYPRQILLVHPDEAQVRIDRETGRREYRFNGEQIPRDRVFHVRGFMLPGWAEGLSMVAQHAQTIGVGLAASDYGARIYNDPHPTAALETDQPVTTDQAKALKMRLRESLRDGGPLVLGLGTQWKPIQLPPHESLFLEAQRYTANDIARLFLVPAEKISAGVDGGGSITYGNRESNVIEFQTDALLPHAIRVEEALNQLLPRGQFVRFNMDAAVRVDLLTRYQAHAIGIQAGFLTDDEARELEDRPPLTDAQRERMNPTPPAEEEEPAVRVLRDETGRVAELRLA